MGAPSKRARKVRAKAEFDVRRIALDLLAPREGVSNLAWTLPEIFNARDLQMLGKFRLPARMAESMRTDDALKVAFENRLAPQQCIPVELVPVKGARGEAVAAEATALFGQGGIGITPETASDIHGCLVNHDVAFGINVAVPREDGSRVDFFHRAWPIEFVEWNSVYRCFTTQTAEGPIEPIVHGDGRWTIYRKHEIEPWKHGALLAAALVWARHAYAVRDWAKGSVAHGNAKVVGEMPAGMPLQNADGKLTAEAQAFIDLLRAIASADSPAGIRPAGSKTDFLTNNSTAWQVWKELVLNAEQAAARIYLGTDGTLGSKGGAPGVDIDSLFGVAKTRVQGDLAAIERGFTTGVIEPWCAVNFGDSSLSPVRKYQIPDADADSARDSLAKRNEMFFVRISAMRANGFVVTQDDVNRIAGELGVIAPVLSPAPLPVAPLPTVTPKSLV